MRIFPHIAVLLIAPMVLVAHVPSIDEILHTNQYLLVSQQDAFTHIEANVPSGVCPRSFVHPGKSRSKDYHFSGAHLVRDVHGSHNPKLLIIKENPKYLRVNMFELNATGMFDGSPTMRSYKDKPHNDLLYDRIKDLQSGAKHIMLKNRPLKASLFDSISHTLYLAFGDDDSHRIEEYYIKGLFSASESYQLQLKRNITVPSGSGRFDWTEDQYAGKFYYKEIIDKELFLFEIPMSAFIPTVYEGESGKKVGVLSMEGQTHGATGGAFFSVSKKLENQTYSFYSTLIPSSLHAGFSCPIATSQTERPFFHRFMIVRNNDYCMLRDGMNYSKETCEEEQKQYLGEQESHIVKWLLVTSIIMFMVIILLIVYIYWLRSTFVYENERTNPNEYETEASLFVAKQRSFPSGYQDPAFLDVSVDRWN